MNRTYTSREGTYVSPDGTYDDEAFHAEILDNDEADLFTRRQSARKAVENGMDPKVAKQLYGDDAV